MQYVEPCNEKNAIKVVGFALDFAREIDEGVIKSAISLYNEDKELNEDLTNLQTQDSIRVEINQGAQIQRQTLGGVVFEKLSEKGQAEWALQVRRHALSVICTNYTRWDENIWPKAKMYLSKILPILEDIQIASTTLEYVDEFIIDKDTTWKEELFKKDNKFLPNNIFQVNDFWHSHHGYFSESSCPQVDKTLNTVNIEYIVEKPKKIHKVAIRTQHKSLTKDAYINETFMDDIFSMSIENNHTANKAILLDLLSDSMLKTINLEGEK